MMEDTVHAPLCNQHAQKRRNDQLLCRPLAHVDCRPVVARQKASLAANQLKMLVLRHATHSLIAIKLSRRAAV